MVVCLTMASAHRTYKEECSFIERIDDNSFLIKKGFVPNMKVGRPGSFDPLLFAVLKFLLF